MMNTYSGSKSAGQDTKRNEQVRRLPVRMHELLGIPRSTGKKTNADGTKIQNPLPQPVRIKDLFGSVSSKKTTTTVSARRITTLANATNNARRQLYNDDPGDRTCSHNVTTISSGSCTVTKKFSEIKSNVQNQKRPQPVRMLGFSKSDGKINRTSDVGRERLKPERMKDFMESWEKSQTVQPSARKFSMVPIHTTNARRKLYGVMPPRTTTTAKVTQTSSAPQKLERDGQESQDGNCRAGNLHEIVERHKISANNQIYNLENSTLLENPTNSIGTKESFEKSVKNMGKKIHKIDDSTEFPRPSVIISGKGISSKGMRKEPQNLSDDSEKSSYEISRPPLRELSRHSVLLQPRLDENATSFEDLLGISRHGRGESFYRENLPPDWLLENAAKTRNSFVNMDIQTLSWIHGNLKLAVQSTEENLYSMKLALHAMEDVMKNYENSETEESRTKIENQNISPPTIVIVPAEEKGDKKSTICEENNVDVETSKKKSEIPFDNEKLVVADSGNEDDGPILENPDEEDKENVFTKNDGKIVNNGETPRRRSLRIAEKNMKSSKSLDDSFSRIEEELNIVHVKTKVLTPHDGKSGKRLDPRSRRSIREYMALKSTMNFLDTPDVKGLPTPKGEKDTPSHRRATRRSLSRRLLTELDDLYAESPL